MLTWLPLLRCLFDGASYRWGQDYFGIVLASEGVSADYFALIIFLAFYLCLFISTYWIKNRIVFYLMLIWWWIHSFGSLIFLIIRDGDTFFHGDTMDVHVSLSAVVIPLAIFAAVLIIMAIIKDRKMPDVTIPWGRRNKKWLWFILAPLALQIPLFAFGEPHGLTDEIGVIIAILQSILFPLIFIPESNPKKPVD